MMKALKIEREEIKRAAKLDKKSIKNNPALRATPKIEIARMAMAIKGVVNHWTLTFKRGPEGFMVYRNPNQPGVCPLP